MQRCAALGAIAMVGALAVVERDVIIQVALQLFERFIERLAEGHGVKFFLHRAMKAFADAVGFRRADVGAPVGDLLDGQIQLEGMPHRSAAVFSAVVGEQVFDLHAVFFVERQHAIVQHMD